MTLRVLHIFPLNYASRFGGQIIWWKQCFSQWSDSDIEHLVLDYHKDAIVNATEAFSFSYPELQNTISRSEKFLWLFRTFSYLRRHIKGYDLLHVHVLWWTGLFIGPWSVKNNIPAIYESILLDADNPTAILKENFGKFKIWCLKQYKAIFAISDYLAKDYLQCGFSNQQVFELTNYVDLNTFYPIESNLTKRELRRKLSLPQDVKILIFVGSIKERKGADVLIQAFIKAIHQYPDLFLIMIGPVKRSENPSLDEDYIQDLLSLLKKNRLSEKVLFTGLIQDRQKLAEMYRASDIFVFPSKREGLGNVILEAMASGLPVIVSELPVLSNLIKNNKNGLFTQIDDAHAVKDAILQLCNDPNLAAKIGRAARNFVQEELSFPIWQSKIMRLYNSLVSGMRTQ